jgi:ABC-type antimicrobial peptide transport system permease subunit
LSHAAPARAALQRIDPNVPILSARTMRAVIDESMADTAFTTTILMVAAIVALLLGAIGLYGVIGYVVVQRTQEIGVRIALGARPRQVQRMVLRQGLVLAAAGVVVGVAGALALTRALESLLYQVDRLDPVTFGVVPVVLLAVSALAAYIPARRASTVSPLQALRAE